MVVIATLKQARFPAGNRTKLKRSAEKQPLNACHAPFQLISNDVLIGNQTRAFVSFNTALECKFEIRRIVAPSILTDAVDLRSKLFVKSACPVFFYQAIFVADAITFYGTITRER